LLSGLAVAVLGQGGFYHRAHVATGVLVVLAGSLVVLGVRRKSARAARPVLAGLGGMAVVAAITGRLDHRAGGVAGYLAALACIAAVVTVTASATVTTRRILADGLLALGVVAAVSGWIGTVFRVQPLAHPDAGLWRAATTVTYANASAALLAMVALVAIGRSAESDGRRREVKLRRAALVAVGSGLVLTLSRAGMSGFVAGGLVLGVLLGWRRLFRLAWPALAASALVVGGALPGMPASGPSRPYVALLGLVAGGAVVWLVPGDAVTGPGRIRIGRRAVIALVATGGAAVAAVGVVAGLHWNAFSGRLGVSSPDRGSVGQAALSMWHSHLVSGVGAGQALFLWSTSGGQGLLDHFAHDEYLQLAAEQGVIGLIGLAGLMTGVGLALRRGWMSARSGLMAGAVSACVCFAIHSGFDFLWHVPAVPMVAAVAVGLGVPVPGTGETEVPSIKRGEPELDASNHMDQGRPGLGERRRDRRNRVRPARGRPVVTAFVADHPR
jgi:hypothetical protein